MASWGATARVEAPVAAPRARPRTVATRRHRPVNPLRSGVTWIVVIGALLAGLVALNVAVLQLNVRLDKLGRERMNLRADNNTLSSQLSSSNATGRIQSLAHTRLGLVPASQTTFVELGGK
jgi:cell division protein FtsL